MTEVAPVYVCSTCGHRHVFLPPEEPINTPEECAELKDAWFRADDYLTNVLLIPQEERNKLEAKVIRNQMAYYTKCGRTGVWRFPETLTTIKVGGQHKIVCSQCKE